MNKHYMIVLFCTVLSFACSPSLQSNMQQDNLEDLNKVPNDIVSYIDFCGKDTFSIINQWESLFLDWLYTNCRGQMSFENRRVLFLKGSSGTIISNKLAYFQGIKKAIKSNQYNPVTIYHQMLILPQDVVDQTGFDIVIGIWVKRRLTPKHILKIIKENQNMSRTKKNGNMIQSDE